MSKEHINLKNFYPILYKLVHEQAIIIIVSICCCNSVYRLDTFNTIYVLLDVGSTYKRLVFFTMGQSTWKEIAEQVYFT